MLFLQPFVCPNVPQAPSIQVAKQLFRFTKYSDKIFTEAVYGGEKIEKQINELKTKKRASNLYIKTINS